MLLDSKEKKFSSVFVFLFKIPLQVWTKAHPLYSRLQICNLRYMYIKMLILFHIDDTPLGQPEDKVAVSEIGIIPS